MPGHQVVAEIELLPDADGVERLFGPDSRSVLFVFPDGDDEVRFGAIVRQIDGVAAPGRRFTARLQFWSDLAELQAFAGAAFDLWYERIVGSGRVIEVLPW